MEDLLGFNFHFFRITFLLYYAHPQKFRFIIFASEILIVASTKKKLHFPIFHFRSCIFVPNKGKISQKSSIFCLKYVHILLSTFAFKMHKTVFEYRFCYSTFMLSTNLKRKKFLKIESNFRNINQIQ